MANDDQNGHHFNFDTRMCVHCDMTFSHVGRRRHAPVSRYT